jgi:hypothetical protein
VIGVVVEDDGLFAALGTRIERIRGGPVVLLAKLLISDAIIVTAVLNLDTASRPFGMRHAALSDRLIGD